MSERWAPALHLGLVRAAVNSARECFAYFGRDPITTDTAATMLRRWNVISELADLPPRYAAMLSPVLLGRLRMLGIAAHVPSLARKLVQLHEAGHLYTGTASAGITYDHDDYHSHDEQLADAFAAVGLLPTFMVDSVTEACVSEWERVHQVAGMLMDVAEGLWEEERARFVARNRLVVREQLGL